MVKKTLTSIQITVNEIVGAKDTVLSSLPHLPIPLLSSISRITPIMALSRLTTLLTMIQSLFLAIPPTCSVPLHPILTTLLSLLDLFVPKGRRGEEASVDGVALSPKEQWLLYPLLYPAVFEVRTILQFYR